MLCKPHSFLKIKVQWTAHNINKNIHDSMNIDGEVPSKETSVRAAPLHHAIVKLEGVRVEHRTAIQKKNLLWGK